MAVWPNRLGQQNASIASLQRSKTPPTSVLVHDTEQSDDEAPVTLALWRMQSTPSLPSLPGRL